jgi:hypothetical protein
MDLPGQHGHRRLTEQRCGGAIQPGCGPGRCATALWVDHPDAAAVRQAVRCAVAAERPSSGRRHLRVAGALAGHGRQARPPELTSVVSGVVALLEHVAATGTTCWLVEDVRWGDPSSLDVLTYVARVCGTCRCCCCSLHVPGRRSPSRLMRTPPSPRAARSSKWHRSRQRRQSPFVASRAEARADPGHSEPIESDTSSRCSCRTRTDPEYPSTMPTTTSYTSPEVVQSLTVQELSAAWCSSALSDIASGSTP